MAKKDVYNVPPVMPDKARKRMTTEVAPLRQQRRKLTPKEWTFVTELVSGDGRVTMKEAAIRAGYKATSASVMAWKLTHPDINPHVVAAIQAYRAELASKYNTSYERHMRDLQVIRDKALDAGAFAAAVQAEYRRGQALGSFSLAALSITTPVSASIKAVGGGPPYSFLSSSSLRCTSSLLMLSIVPWRISLRST